MSQWAALFILYGPQWKEETRAVAPPPAAAKQTYQLLYVKKIYLLE